MFSSEEDVEDILQHAENYMMRRLSKYLRVPTAKLNEEDTLFTKNCKIHSWVKPENLSLHHKDSSAVNRVFVNEAIKLLSVIDKDAYCPQEKYLAFELFDCAVDWMQRLGSHDKL